MTHLSQWNRMRREAAAHLRRGIQGAAGEEPPDGAYRLDPLPLKWAAYEGMHESHCFLSDSSSWYSTDERIAVCGVTCSYGKKEVEGAPPCLVCHLEIARLAAEARVLQDVFGQHEHP